MSSLPPPPPLPPEPHGRPAPPPPPPPRSTPLGPGGLPAGGWASGPAAGPHGGPAPLPGPPPLGAPGAGPETCYRHPGRDAGRRCTRCGRVACSECLVQASIGSHCVDCVKATRPPAAQRVQQWSATNSLLATKVLIALNLAVYVYIAAKGASDALGGNRVTQVQFDLGLNRVFIAEGEYYRLLTAGFIHFGLIHLGFNMFAFWNLGQMLEPISGRVQYVLLYFAALLAGSAGALVVGGNGITGGASGAVFGLFGAAAVALRQRGINPFQTSIGSVLILNLVLTFAIPGISIGGHLGGLVGGAVCGAAVFAPHWKRHPTWLTYLVPVAVAVASVVVSVAVSTV